MFTVLESPAFTKLIHSYRSHRKISLDIKWLREKLELAPKTFGDQVPGLQGFKFPIYKTRLKDGCCGIGQSGGWRVYYAVDIDTQKVHLLFIVHKKEMDNPKIDYLSSKLDKAFEDVA